jgi:hypothetical protein
VTAESPPVTRAKVSSCVRAHVCVHMCLHGRVCVFMCVPVTRGAKVSAIRILADISSIRANFRLSKILAVFKELAESPEGRRELRRHHCYALEGKEVTRTGMHEGAEWRAKEAMEREGHRALTTPSH